jgi:hypothetical protein
MSEVYTIVECKVTYNDNSTEIRRPTFSEISVGLASVDKISVLKYLQDNLSNVSQIEIIDTLYFRNKSEYEKYLKSQ